MNRVSEMKRDFVDLFDVSPAEARLLLDRAAAFKREDKTGLRPPRLSGRILGLIFEKPSLRTRVSFESAIARLGGNAIFLRGKDVGIGVRESVEDFARVISQYVDVMAIRTFAHSTVEDLARFSSIPVINALSDSAHPCQAMADLMTVEELRGSVEGAKIVFVGDGNNVARSLAQASALLGATFVLAAPAGYEFPPEFRADFKARFSSTPLAVETDPRLAVVDADVVYTDVWASMGQEDQADARREVFAPFQVTEALMKIARPDAFFLHCLPAHRGEEVESEVLDGPQSRIIQQAGNRLYFQMALLDWLLEGVSSA